MPLIRDDALGSLKVSCLKLTANLAVRLDKNEKNKPWRALKVTARQATFVKKEKLAEELPNAK